MTPTIQMPHDADLTCAARLLAVLVAALLFMAVAAPAPAQPTKLPLTDLSLYYLSAFRPAGANWRLAGIVAAALEAEQTLHAEPGVGILVNLPGDGGRDNLFTAWEHGDLALELDFMMPKGSNAGIYLQGRYEVQLFDSWGVQHPRASDLGGIYERWDDRRPDGEKGYEGVPPRFNAGRAPGLWQHLRIVFQAPRFDEQGRKVADARFVTVELNGVAIHQDVAVTGPTRAAAFTDEQPYGPLMIQGDHGPIAFRNLRYKTYGADRIALNGLRYQQYEGIFTNLDDLDGLTPTRAEATDGLYWEVGGPQNGFALRYDGRLTAPKTGYYRFQLQLDWITGDPHFQGKPIGGGRLVIDDEVALVHTGQHHIEGAKVYLTAGTHPFSLTYYKNRDWYAPTMALYVEGPDQPLYALNAPGTLPTPPQANPIFVEPQGEPVVLRSMIEHRGARRTHVASVGDPAGVHYTMDLAQGALLYAWRGPFLDATPMWHSRGQDQVVVPQGSILDLPGLPALAPLPDADAPWPDAYDAENGYRFGGYALDDAGRPTFLYHLGEVAVEDVTSVDAPTLVRTLTLRAPQGVDGLWVLLAADTHIALLPDGRYSVGERTYYLAPEQTGGAEPVLRTQGDRQELLVPVRFEGGEARISYAIIW